MADNTVRPGSSPSLSSGPFHYFVPLMVNLDLFFSHGNLTVEGNVSGKFLRVHVAQTIPVPYHELLVLSYLECENPLSDLTTFHRLAVCTF